MYNLAVTLPKYNVDDVYKDVEKEKATELREHLGWGPEKLGLLDVWRKAQGIGTKVAVLDTGVDLNHPDLKHNISNTVDFTGDGVQDTNGHGTHCAGIIAAGMNGFGMVGVAPQAKLAVAKVLANNGSGSYDWIVKGINWAVDEADADIISMSLGGPVSTPELYEAIHRALAKGKIIVCAAGNEGSIYSNTIGYPGRYGSVLTIAAHDENGNRAGFSSYGGEVDFMAPGSKIYSTHVNGGYARLSGTSMATPFVAGVCALIKSANRGIENCEQMRNELMDIAAHKGSHHNERGYGPLNVFQYFYS